MSILFLNQSAVHYESIGRGRPVLFLHGWLGSWRYWVPAMEHISASHTAYALDLAGYGDTAPVASPQTVDDQSLLVEGFLSEMGIGRIGVVGHGLGALAGLALAGRVPSRMVRVMAIGLPLDPKSLLRWQPDAREFLGQISGTVEGVQELFPELSLPYSKDLNIDAYATGVRAGFAALHEAQVPCVLVYGARDPVVRPPSTEHSLAFGENVHRVVLPASGHFPMLDAPEAFHRLLLDFLTMGAEDDPRSLEPRNEWRRKFR